MAPFKTDIRIIQASLDALALSHGNQSEAARRLNIPRPTIQHHIEVARRMGLKVPEKETVIPTADTSAARTADRLRVERLERDIKDLKEQNKRLAEEALTTDAVRRLIHDCDAPLHPPHWLQPTHQGITTGVPCLVASDFHWDEVVDPKQINGVNKFNREIAVRRCRDLFTKTIDLLMNHMRNPQYDYFRLMLLGDLISGNIHDELAETNEYTVTESLISVVDHLAAGIVMLHDAFGRVEVDCLGGNHGRIHHKPRAKNRATDSYEWIGFQILARHFAHEKDIHFNIAEGPDLPIQIYGTKYLLTHGDQAKGGSGIAGLLSPLMLMDARKRKRYMSINLPYDYVVMGHWHEHNWFKQIIVNGTLKGYDEYAATYLNASWEPATQALWITHPDHPVTARWPIYLERHDTRWS